MTNCCRAVPLTWLLLGCISVEAPHPIAASSPAVPPVSADAKTPEANHLSGTLDGPTLRLALHDLAIILDTLGRLEQIRPELRSQMLAELADADADTAAAVVKKWRAKIAETPRTTPAATLSPAVQRPSAPSAEQPKPAVAQAPAASPAPPPQPVPSLEINDQPRWEELLEPLLDQARERAESWGPDRDRGRVDLALLEILAEADRGARQGGLPDAALWHRLAAAVDFFLTERPPEDDATRAALAALSRATERLRGPAPPPRLETRNLAFCKRIQGYGKIERIEPASFSAGQPLLLYSEVENLSAESVAGGLRSKLSSELELLDSEQRAVWRQPFAAVEDVSESPRRDYFLSHTFRLPANLRPGRYQVQLTLHDELAKRSNSGRISLEVR